MWAYDGTGDIMKYNLKRDKEDKRDYKFAQLVAPVMNIKLPRKVDLREKFPECYDQGSLGSCTANAGCGFMSYKYGKPFKMFSRLFLYYKERYMEGNVDEDSGASMRSIPKALNKYGVCLEQYMPYNVNDYAKPPSATAEENASKFMVNSYHKVQNLDEIKQCIALRQMPVLIGMDVYESFEDEIVKQTGKMRMPMKDEKYLGAHAVLAVGYDDGCCFREGKLIVRNSWGKEWGDRGYFYMPYSYVEKGHTFDYWTLF